MTTKIFCAIVGMASQNPDDSQGNADETPLSPDELHDMRRMMQQHREEQSKQSNNVSLPPSSQPDTSSKATTIQKLSKFKKFAPMTIKEAKTPNEAEEWLEELEVVLEALHTEEEDRKSVV